MDNNKLLEIFGTEDLVKMFQEMNVDVQNKILTTSFKKASKIIISKAQGNLGGKYKKVSKSLGDVMRKNEKALYVGSIRKKGGHLSHIANAGTKERGYTSVNGNFHKTGKIIGNHFWDNALTSTEKNVEEVIYEDIKKRFEAYINKNNKK